MPMQATERKGVRFPLQKTHVAEQTQSGKSRECHSTTQSNSQRMGESLPTCGQQRGLLLRIPQNLADALAVVPATPPKQEQILGAHEIFRFSKNEELEISSAHQGRCHIPL